MSRWLAVTLSGLIAVAVAGGCFRRHGPAADLDLPAKLLLITIDTTRADHVSAYGYPRQTTPTLDALAVRGVRFANAYTVMPTTDPAHASMLTGQYPRTHGVTQNAVSRANPEGPSLALWLKERGYVTAAITARLGLDPPLRRIRGFDHSDAPKLPAKERDAGEILALAQTWLAAGGRTRWFLWAHFWEPHKPYRPEAAARERFSKRPIPRQRRFEDPVRFLPAGRSVDSRTVDAAVSLYDAEIWSADRAIARLIEAATQAPPSGVAPLIVVVGDHGESLAERQEETRIGFGHGTHINDEVVKVPWIVVWDGHARPGVIRTPVSLVDLTPTLIDLIEPGASLDCEGRSLASAVINGREPPPVPIVLDRRPFRSKPIPGLRHAEYAWIEYPWKLIQREGGARARLYDLARDPGERKDVAEEEPGVVERLGSSLDRWKAERPLRRDRERSSAQRAAEREALRSLGYVD
jgi:arylsulfatase A-like enzyme